MKNSLQSLHTAGQSVWLDELSRELLTGGELQRLIADDGVRGVVANSASLARAIAAGGEYRDIL